MPATKETKEKLAETIDVPEEAQAQADAQLEKLNAQTDEAPSADFSKPRRKSGRTNRTFYPDYDMLVADYAPGLNWERFGPTAFAAVQYGPRTGSTRSQEFTLDEERVKYLHFQKPGMDLPQKRLYTVKAFHQDGRLVQLPFELQIQNTAGGDAIDAIGLRRYQRKGIQVLIDWNTMQPIYCAAWGCHAKADGETGFCTERHAKHTMPNRFKDADKIRHGVFGENATTSRVWSA